MRRSTIIYILLFLVMAGLYYYLNHRPEPANIAVTPGATEEISYLFKTTDGQPTDIRVEAKDGGVVELALDANKAWTLVKPIATSAEQGSAEAAATELTAIQITNKLPATVSPKDVGLDAPDYKLTVKFNSGVERIVEVGVVTPTGNGYYVEMDNQIVAVSKDSLDPLLQLINNPPYAQTLTPSPTLPPATMTETPLPPTPEIVATATTQSATPTP